MTVLCLKACMGIKYTCLDEFPPGHPKMLERMLDIISLFVIYFRVFCFVLLFPMKTVGKLNYFTHCPDLKKKKKGDKDNLYMTCTQK